MMGGGHHGAAGKASKIPSARLQNLIERTPMGIACSRETAGPAILVPGPGRRSVTVGP